ncbi:hypothetical protein [Nocardioides acrostichi]|uniref:Lipoprotein LprG n=1 Tax=Nocardioides acrostichi TaxID=2784339 RepID=A0A930V0A3_9ACTN|nr:hypothetical protein [Nocardioides acrostichi]MBF4162310.1 hypothetical protein [Nocardioides acrostichi]
MRRPFPTRRLMAPVALAPVVALSLAGCSEGDTPDAAASSSPSSSVSATARPSSSPTPTTADQAISRALGAMGTYQSVHVELGPQGDDPRLLIDVEYGQDPDVDSLAAQLQPPGQDSPVRYVRQDGQMRVQKVPGRAYEPADPDDGLAEALSGFDPVAVLASVDSVRPRQGVDASTWRYRLTDASGLDSELLGGGAGPATVVLTTGDDGLPETLVVQRDVSTVQLAWSQWDGPLPEELDSVD